jgi:hypothetical protein
MEVFRKLFFKCLFRLGKSIFSVNVCRDVSVLKEKCMIVDKRQIVALALGWALQK